MGRAGCRYTIDDWRAVKRALGSGATIRGAAAACGVGRGTVHRWSLADAPPEGVWLAMEVDALSALAAPRAGGARARLAYRDRVIIYVMDLAGARPDEIAESVGCHRTTVSRELRRAGCGRYDPRVAQMDADLRARRPKARKVDADPRLRAYVLSGLAERWSPEQISLRMRADFPDNGAMRISHETIYQALYVQGRGALRDELRVEQALRSGRASRRPRSKLPARDGDRTWVEGCEISLRPAEAEDRAVPGHWEGDLVVGGDLRSCLVTLVERTSRFLVARRLADHRSETVVGLLQEMAGEVPGEVLAALARSLTWDQGTELAYAARFAEATGIRVFFCDPRSPWQRGTNENTNGLIRQYFPKGTDFSKVADEEVEEMVRQLNGRPRKTLGWRTPAEVLNEILGEVGATTA